MLRCPTDGAERKKSTADTSDKFNVNNYDPETGGLFAAPSITAFADLPIDSTIHQGIAALGYEKPSYVQRCAIMPLLPRVKSSHHLIAQAASGNGKTAAFTIAALALCTDDTYDSRGGPAAIILEPTRELAEQTARCVREIGKFTGVKVSVCCGGSRFRQNADELRPRRPVVRRWRRAMPSVNPGGQKLKHTASVRHRSRPS